METTSVRWKSGSVVRLLSGGKAMKVIGSDSVGSVICRLLNDDRYLDVYLPPSLLVTAEPDASACEQSTDMVAENA